MCPAACFVRDFDIPQVGQMPHKMVSDDVEVIAASIESQHQHLPTPFFDFDAAAVGYLQKRFGFEVFGDLFLMLAPCRLSSSTNSQISSAWLWSQMLLGTLLSVTDADQNWNVGIFDREKGYCVVFLVFVPKGFEVVKDRLQLGQLRKDFFYFKVQGFHNIVAELAKLLCEEGGGLKGWLKGFFPFRNPLVSVGEAFWATVPNAAVALKHRC